MYNSEFYSGILFTHKMCFLIDPERNCIWISQSGYWNRLQTHRWGFGLFQWTRGGPSYKGENCRWKCEERRHLLLWKGVQSLLVCASLWKVCLFWPASWPVNVFPQQTSQLQSDCYTFATTNTFSSALIYAVVEHVPSTRIGATCFGGNLEEVTAGLCRPLYCRNAHSLQGIQVFNIALKRHLLKLKKCIYIFFSEARRHILPQRWEWEVHLSRDRPLCYMGGEACSLLSTQEHKVLLIWLLI